ncbi:50S ribosomal protein L25/general stress protein Ctc [Camelimonas abortus]|uniref:Large ribosomal subunit protein bL25 n=1 Tax=Camelimonas abortus TaxID=1017184 RepID=A0ABV7LFD9_9HYPH
MTAVKQIIAEARDRVGKGAARALRRQGRTPAVIYGAGKEPLPISIEYAPLRQAIYAGGFMTTIFEIRVGDRVERVIPRDYQLDPVRDTPLHVDFLRVTSDATIDVEVPVHFINHEASPGLKAGGTLNVVRHHVSLSVSPNAIPEAIEIDLTGLQMGDTIHISAVKLPEGAQPSISDRDFTIASVVPPTVSEEAAAAEGAPEA